MKRSILRAAVLLLSSHLTLAVAQINCNNPIQLTQNLGTDFAPAWNPASETIAYMVITSASVQDIGRVQSNGTGEGLMATGPATPFGIAFSLSWVGSTGLLMTNEQVVFHEYMTFNSALAPFTRTVSDGNDAAFTRKLLIPGGGGGGLIRVSRDGLTVLWQHNDSGNSGANQIRQAPFSVLDGQTTNAVGTQLTPLNRTGFYTNGASLTPDGSKFVISKPSGSGHDLFLHNTSDGSLVLQLTTTGASNGVSNITPDISPDGTKVAFASNDNGAGGTMARFDLFVIDLSGTGLANITNSPLISEVEPTFAPDGQRLAYRAVDSTAPTPNSDIYVCSLAAPLADLTSGLVGHWAMNEAAGSTAAADSSGSGNTATCSGTACPTFGVPGQIGTAAGFDGSNDVLQVNNTVPDSFTISAWIKTTSVGANTAGGQGFGGNGIIYSDVPGGASDMIPMALVSDRLGFDTGSANNCTSDDTLTSTVAVNTGQWVHVAVTRNVSTGVKQLYINGVLNGTNSNGGTCPLSGNPNIIFGGNTVDVRYFNGQMDDVYFYDRVLSASEIQSLMNGIVTPPPAISGCPISGSTGAQGVFDSSNRDETIGVAWPANAAVAIVEMETGQVTFFDSSGTPIATATGFPNPAPLPGFSGSEDGLHFTSIRLESGKQAAFLTNSSALTPPVILRSCQDVILETGSSLSWGFDPDLTNAFPAGFLGGSGANTVSEGFGPRLGPSPAYPAAGSLYPAIGGGGGKGGSGLVGGRGGPAFVIAASQRITLNGTIYANGMDATQSGTTGAEGGAGGSVRLGSVLIEGIGSIITAAGKDSNGAVSEVAGPIAIQAFLQDLYTGSTTAGATVSRSNVVIAPVPDNLPEIVADFVSTAAEFCSAGTPSTSCRLGAPTGSLTSPDVTLTLSAAAAGSAVSVNVEVFTIGVPNGNALLFGGQQTTLTFRAVGSDGIAVSGTGPVVPCECAANEGMASATLSLKAGVTYQIVVYPANTFAMATARFSPVPLAEPVLYATSRKDRGAAVQQSEKIPEEEISSPLEKWARAFGAEPQAHKKLAQLHLSKQETQ